MTSFSDEIGAGNGAGTPSSILAPIDSLDRWIRFTELSGDFPPTTLPFDTATDTYLLLTTGDGTLVGAESWRFDGATFQQITSGTVPDGYEYLSARDAAQWNRLVFLEFSSVVPSRRIGIVLSPAGASRMPDGAASTAEFPDDAVTVLSYTSRVASYPDGRRYRYNAELGIDDTITRPAGWGGWLIEVDGQPFEPVEELMAIVDEIGITPEG